MDRKKYDGLTGPERRVAVGRKTARMRATADRAFKRGDTDIAARNHSAIERVAQGEESPFHLWQATKG